MDRVLKTKGIAFKLVLFFVLSSSCIFAAIFSYNYFVSRRLIVKAINENSEHIIMAATNKIEALLSATQKVPENIAYFLENSNNDEKELLQVLFAVVEKIQRYTVLQLPLNHIHSKGMLSILHRIYTKPLNQ